eukprot:UN02128
MQNNKEPTHILIYNLLFLFFFFPKPPHTHQFSLHIPYTHTTTTSKPKAFKHLPLHQPFFELYSVTISLSFCLFHFSHIILFSSFFPQDHSFTHLEVCCSIS